MLRTITAGELVALLSDLDEDTPVVFSSDYGDHSHTEQAIAIKGRVDEEMLKHSAYSGSGWAVADCDDDDDDDGNQMFVVVIK